MKIEMEKKNDVLVLPALKKKMRSFSSSQKLLRPMLHLPILKCILKQTVQNNVSKSMNSSGIATISAVTHSGEVNLCSFFT